MSFVWDTSPTQAFNGMYTAWANAAYNSIVTLANVYAPNIQNWMKDNAPWTDQTANLRQSLYAEVETQPNKVIISFDYGLDYGKYLEFSNAGTYAIIAPTLDTFAPKVMRSLQELFR